MKSTIVKKLTLFAVLGAALAVPAFAQPGPGGGPGGGAGFAQGAGQGYGPGWSLMSPAEREAHRMALRSATSIEDCRKLQVEHRALIESRAKERGITLPPEPSNVCERIRSGARDGASYGPGRGPRNGAGSSMGRGPGNGQGAGPGMGLLTPEEMAAHRNAMRATKNVGECQALQSEHRALLESRAKEKGVALPQPGQNACERMFSGGAQSRMGGGRGNRAGWDLLTPEEREAHMAQMRAVKTFEECKVVQAEHRAVLESRAKEKGVNLPPPRTQACERMQARGLIQ